MARRAFGQRLADSMLNVPEIRDRLVAAVRDDLAGDGPSGYLTPERAAHYLGLSRKRIYDLKSMRAIEPDGYDGRTPLFTRATLDAYVLGGSGR